MPKGLDYTTTTEKTNNAFHLQYANNQSASASLMPPIENYSEFLNEYGLHFKKEDIYFQIGEIEWTQGWILDISSVIYQLHDLLKSILPLLKRENIPAKIIQNSKKATSILNGELGYIKLGKLVSLFPSDEIQAIKIAKELIKITGSIKGPQILTDRQLCGVVYTRYGSGNPIIQTNENGIQDNYIYDVNGNLIKEPYHIPFELPEGIHWPFNIITSAKPRKKETVLQDRYKPMGFLKEDAKGDVKKGLRLGKWLQVSWCVIKEAKQYMSSDPWGRDAVDRLRWQFELHKELEGAVPIPAVYDFFEENGNSYLIMEYIKGISLQKKVSSILNGQTWSQLILSDRLILLEYATQVFDIIDRMHKKGYLHRDITPANFLVKKNQKLWMIDLELSYSEGLKKPSPPFRLGTPGFMSPEQQKTLTPTEEQDIYAIGSLLIFIFTGLLPDNFALDYIPTLREQLIFFIPSLKLVDVIINCFLRDPKERPSLLLLKTEIEDFREKQEVSEIKNDLTKTSISLYNENLTSIIKNGLNGLASRDLISKEGLWISKTAQEGELAYYQMESVSIYKSFYDGLSGILYVLARAHKLGLPISTCIDSYEKSVSFIRKNNIAQLTNLPGGLYMGTAGFAIAMIEGIYAGLIANTQENKETVKLYLQNSNIVGNGLVKGIVGQGIVLLKANYLLIDEGFTQALLQQKKEQLLQQQEPDGSWVSLTDRNHNSYKITGWGHGVAGILCFLLEYCKQNKTESRVEDAIYRGLEWLRKQAIIKKDIIRWSLNDKTKAWSSDFQDGCAGVILSLIKGYEYFGEPRYRILAEDCLSTYPKTMVTSNITLASGLIGIGEVYLEAAKIFANEEWTKRATWIADFIIHNFHKEENGPCYWIADGSTQPTAGFMTGCSGIIHFLMRYEHPGQLSHPLLVYRPCSNFI